MKRKIDYRDLLRAKGYKAPGSPRTAKERDHVVLGTNGQPTMRVCSDGSLKPIEGLVQ